MDFNYDSGIIDTIYILDTTQTPPTTNASGVQNVLSILGGAIALPTSATSVTSPANGMLRYNTSGWIDAYLGSTWTQLTTGSGISITTVSGSGPYYLAMASASSGAFSAADVNVS